MGPIVPLGFNSCVSKAANFSNQYKVPVGQSIKLSNIDPNDTAALDLENKEVVDELFKNNRRQIHELQRVLGAENKHALLIIIQGMDACGKDRAIRRVLCINPKGLQVASFKAPSEKERRHDYLWRIHKDIPEYGSIGVFHRSHYEDVIPTRVKNKISEDVLELRYEQINNFEKYLSENNVKVIKFYFHMGNEEQLKRLIERRDNPRKQFKLSINDFEERKLWGKYMEAYEQAITKCNTPWAPWFIIPANNKWFKDLVFSQIVLETLQELDMKYPPPPIDPNVIDIG